MYAHFMKNVGPVSQFSCYKFEAKHKYLKKSAYIISCKKDTAYSVAVKHQLHMCYRFINSSSIFPSLIIGPKKTIDKYKETRIIALLPDDIKNNFIISNWIEYKGTRFHANLVVMIDENESGPLFDSIDAIIVSQNIVIFHCDILTTIGFNERIRAYEIRFSGIKTNVNIEDLSDPFPISLHTNIHNEKYVILRYAI
ncbi:hypothetical protein ALC62_11187 [Cyphomyrmex costatus]|uniref:Uncharacterized protein n=1 Tax=Cyphomyrmex costatus TaxID=456900 RepID=A0A151ICP0_9HYME|nr:hypothetical protein ALC62_11187 [Cyphomyrmex costatus]